MLLSYCVLFDFLIIVSNANLGCLMYVVLLLDAAGVCLLVFRGCRWVLLALCLMVCDFSDCCCAIICVWSSVGYHKCSGMSLAFVC